MWKGSLNYFYFKTLVKNSETNKLNCDKVQFLVQVQGGTWESVFLTGFQMTPVLLYQLWVVRVNTCHYENKKELFSALLVWEPNIIPHFSLVGSCELAHKLSCELLIPAKWVIWTKHVHLFERTCASFMLTQRASMLYQHELHRETLFMKSYNRSDIFFGDNARLKLNFGKMYFILTSNNRSHRKLDIACVTWGVTAVLLFWIKQFLQKIETNFCVNTKNIVELAR